jgi:hypothetical protein
MIHDRCHQEYLFLLAYLVNLVKFFCVQPSRLLHQVFQGLCSDFGLELPLSLLLVSLDFLPLFLKLLPVLSVLLLLLESRLLFHLFD